MRSTNLTNAHLVQERVEELRKLRYGWDGYDTSAPPSVAALDRAQSMLATIEIEPRNDGGVSVVISGQWLATINQHGELI